MNETRNKQIIREVFDQLATGDARPFVGILADDIAWTIIGTTSLSKTFQGKGEVLSGLLGKLASTLDGPIRVTADRILADEDYVVIQCRGESRTKAGVPYCNTYCWVTRLNAEGKIDQLTEYLDTELVTAAFGR